MADIVDQATRSRMMSGIQGRNTKPEVLVRKALFRLGCRFRLHSARLPGKPDIVLPKWKSVVMVHGCFWHRHEGCRFAYMPKSRTQFWSAKFARNVERDEENRAALKALGWRVVELWECEVRDGSYERILRRRFKKR